MIVSPSAAEEPILSVRKLRKAFGGVLAVADISFDVLERQVTALIGPNGAGKTTVFNLITNVFPYDAGQINFLGSNLRGMSMVDIAGLGLIRTFQSARVFPGMTVIENALVGAHRQAATHGFAQMVRLPRARRVEKALRERAEELLDIVRLSRFRDYHAIELPMGAQKLLEVVRALMAGPRLLCLDEPAAGLNDSETAELAGMLRAVRSIGIPILVVEHNMSLVMNVADSIVVLDAGSVIASGGPAEIRRNARVIEAYLGRDDAVS
jgi:branched-chain amino acid transport system ATP-binding protein